ncbi:PTS transporter subunit EIIC [Enterobacter sp. SA187]|uniref:PTS transporter subunit EIIC n=1 Tax=Enterobacter sp. SA187 TaxID=1914861 RepID=UPI000932B1B5|nr:PTS transporter subunit EIIC [Enterobacter sp. SA187]
MKQTMQMIGQAMLVPISIITVGSMFMGFGSAFTSSGTIEALHLQNIITKGSLLFTTFSVMKATGDVVFRNLPLFFAIGVAFGLAKKEKGWAAFSGAVCFMAMHFIIATLLELNGITPQTTSVEFFRQQQHLNDIAAVQRASIYTSELGMFSYRMSVFGGMAVGLITAGLHNRLYNVKLPLVLSFFAGTRTVPIVTLMAGSLLGVLLYVIWPPLGGMLAQFSRLIGNSGLFGTFIWAVADKSLLPVGLHHLITTPIRLTELGGSMTVCNQLVSGTTNIYMAQLGCEGTPQLLVRGFQSGRVVVHFGALPGAALAIYQCAKSPHKKVVAGLLIPVVATMILFGVTEPIEYTFLFVAPWLFYLVHVPLTGLAFVLTEMANVSIYGGSLKDILPVLLQPAKLNLWGYLWLVPLFFVLYYALFRFLILRFNVMTPGREEDEATTRLYSKQDFNEQQGMRFARHIIEAFGGKENIEQFDNCISRLRVQVKDGSRVAPEAVWKKTLRAKGYVQVSERAFQIIYGAEVVMIAGDCKELLDEGETA